MNVCKICSFLLQPQRIHSLLNYQLLIILFLLLLPHAKSISFNFSSFETNMNNITFQGDAFTTGGVLQLTKNQLDASITQSAGRASYHEPVRLWDAKTGRLTDLTTHFSFIINAINQSKHGDGLVKDEKPAGHSTCPTSSASHSTSSTSDSTCGDHTVQQLLEEGDHSVVQLLEENPQKSEEDHTCFHATSPFSSSSLKTMSSVSSSPVNSSIASSTVNSSIPYLQNSCFS